MDKSYGWKSGEAYLYYHNNAHPRYVERKSLEIFDEISEVAPWELVETSEEVWKQAQAAGGDEFEGLKGNLQLMRAYQRALAKAHDLAQFSSIGQSGFRNRSRGTSNMQNEGESAVLLYQLMQRFKTADGTKVFEQINLRRVQQDVKTTYVETTLRDVETSVPEGGGKKAIKAADLSQPYNKEDTHLSGRILGLCDLRASYTEPSEVAIAWGNMEFLELNDNVGKVLREALHGISDVLRDDETNNSIIEARVDEKARALSDEQRSNILLAIENWYLGQVYFFAFQESQTLKIIDMIKDPKVREIIMKKFKMSDSDDVRNEMPFDQRNVLNTARTSNSVPTVRRPSMMEMNAMSALDSMNQIRRRNLQFNYGVGFAALNVSEAKEKIDRALNIYSQDADQPRIAQHYDTGELIDTQLIGRYGNHEITKESEKSSDMSVEKREYEVRMLKMHLYDFILDMRLLAAETSR
jgi:hypothetical protein